MAFQTPIVLIIYNRPEKTRQVFSMIKCLKPAHLFIIADGGKSEADSLLCNEARGIIDLVDWDTTLNVNASDLNLGNAQRTITGLDWVFEHTNRAIILEDDCVPHPSFFEFCDTLLQTYAPDEEVMHISGCNLLGTTNTGASYFFSDYVVPPWGWATWKRAWQKFNPVMDSWQQHKTEIHPHISQEHFKTWTDTFEYLRLHKVTWDIPWNIDIWANKGIGIVPSTNLISNIGFDEAATFTKKNHAAYSKLPVTEMQFPIIHPETKQIHFSKELEAACIDLLKNLSE